MLADWGMPVNDVVPSWPRTVELSVATTGDFRSLHAWLRELPAVSVDVVAAAVRPGEQGAGWDMMSVAFGSGGAGIALLHTLRSWLESRRSTVAIRVRGAGADRDVRLEASNIDDVMPLLEKLLNGAG